MGKRCPVCRRAKHRVILCSSCYGKELAETRDMEANIKAHEELLGMSTPWPLQEILKRLIEATEHLLDHHSCDCIGHEGKRYATYKAKALMERLRSKKE